MNSRIVALLGALLLASTCFAASELPAGLIQDSELQNTFCLPVSLIVLVWSAALF